MTNIKIIAIAGVLLAQMGCTTLASKDISATSGRLPANNANMVLLVGAERTPENVQTEESIGRLVLSLQRNFQYCYERELNSNPGLNTELFFLFWSDSKRGYSSCYK